MRAHTVGSPAHEMAFRRAKGQWMYVPMDGTSLAVPAARAKGFALEFRVMGTAKTKARGLEVINALVAST